jgi:hypothetical protein
MNVVINVKLMQAFGIGEKLREAANLYHSSCVPAAASCRPPEGSTNF